MLVGQKPYRLFFGLALVGFLVACSPQAPNPDQSTNQSATLPLVDGQPDFEQMREANAVEQCVKTTRGPCPCNQGGEPVAINQRYVSALNDYYPEQADGFACAQVVLCSDAEPELQSGRCTLS